MKQLSNGIIPRGFFGGKGGRRFPGIFGDGYFVDGPFNDFGYPNGPRFPQPGDFFPGAPPMGFMAPHPGMMEGTFLKIELVQHPFQAVNCIASSLREQ